MAAPLEAILCCAFGTLKESGFYAWALPDMKAGGRVHAYDYCVDQRRGELVWHLWHDRNNGAKLAFVSTTLRWRCSLIQRGHVVFNVESTVFPVAELGAIRDYLTRVHE